MKRKYGIGLVKSEERILLAALTLNNTDTPQFHGYLLNQHLASVHSKGLVMSTLYRSLSRLADRGLLNSDWELAPNSEQWRRVYRLTGQGISVATLLSAGETNPKRLGLAAG